MPVAPTSRLHPAAVLLVAAALRLLALGARSLWLDEAFSLWLANRPLAFIWTQTGQPHPPLYFSLLHAWRALIGPLTPAGIELVARLPSTYISLLNLGLLYQLGRRLASRRVAVLAVALLAVAPLDVWYAQEARLYPLIATMALLLALGLATGGRRGVALTAVGLGAGLYVDYTLLLLWAALTAVALALHWAGARPFDHRAWLAGSLAGLLLFWPGAPALAAALERLDEVVFLVARVRDALGVAAVSPPAFLLLFLLGAVLALAAARLAAAAWRRPGGRRLLVVASLVVFTAITAFAPLPRLFSVKRLLVTGWPFVALWIAFLLAMRARRVAAPLVVLSLAATLLMTAVPKDDWRGVAAHVDARAAPGDLVWLDPEYNNIPYHLYAPEQALMAPMPGRQYEAFVQLGPDTTGIWLVVERFSPVSPSQRWLDVNWELRETTDFYRLQARYYTP